MPLYEVAILEQPTAKQLEEGEGEKLLLGPIAVVAPDPQAAAISVVLDHPVPNVARSRMQVLIRPFA